MIRLRKVLLCNYPYYLMLLLALITTLFRINIDKKSIYSGNQKELIGYIYDIKIINDKVEIVFGDKELVVANYYIERKEQEYFKRALNLHDRILIKGNFINIKEDKENVIFNYEEYYKRQNIFYKINVEEISLVSKNRNLYYSIKNFFISKCTSPYLKTFILGDTSYIDKKILKNYRDLGISHLFAISGMHISLLSSFFLFILKKLHIREEKRYLSTGILLILYLLIAKNSPSILRATLFFILFSINKVYYLYIKNTNIFIIVLVITLLINPWYLYNIGFWYSFVISFSLLFVSSRLSMVNGYFKSLLMVSIISFIVSIPISIYFFNQVNYLGIVYNLFYVPFVSFLLFPFAIISFLFPKVTFIFNILIFILESSSNILSNIKFSILILKECSIFIYILYCLFISLILIGINKREKIYFIPLCLLLCLHYLYPYFDTSDYLIMIDVGQGDSILLHSNNKNILIDTGGIMNYSKDRESYSPLENTTIPLLKKEGIRKIDILILTHGDYDHLGDALKLINQYRVDKIYINEGHLNYLERKIIKRRPDTRILKQDTYLKVGDFEIMSLNKDLEEENDSSIVLYAKKEEKKILLMGDASIKTERSILNDYEIGHVDILKCGHHGSKTSSSLDFLKAVSPDIALISAGVDNKFNHPSIEVVKRIKKLGIEIRNTQELGNVKIII